VILRKPYAFLIKNFKKIHLIIFLLTAFTIYNSSRILSFFNDYVLNKTAFYSNSLADEYIFGYMYILSILISVFSIIIYILMKQKEKPRKLYIIMIILYIALPALFYVNYNYLNIIQFQGLEPRLA
jgi:Na+/melibiose symporter-like transporter